jgi:flagellar biosynthesis protein FliP
MAMQSQQPRLPTPRTKTMLHTTPSIPQKSQHPPSRLLRPIFSIFHFLFSISHHLRVLSSLFLANLSAPSLLAIVMLLLALTTTAHAQSTPAPFYQPAGPPTPAQQQILDKERRTEELRQFAASMGIPLDFSKIQSPPDSASSSTITSDPGAISAPDASSIFPTTSQPKKISTSIAILLLLSLLTLAPSILLMTTCFTRIIIVMSLLRQALGAAQLPPNQILIGLSLFMTFMVMGPTWSKVNADAISPYNDGTITQGEAFTRGTQILREFMIKQVEGAHNQDDVYLFNSYAHPDKPEPSVWKEVDTTVLIPAFVLSELKVAFLMGFRVYLPFLIIDMVISSVLISIGMQLLPPVMVSLPFKLLLFVLVDGWHLVCGTLMASFNTG